ncbi:hypothetical protein R3I94_000580 [Phoxinus phoxinus]
MHHAQVLDGLRNHILVYDPIGNYKSISEMDLAILCNAFRNTWENGLLSTHNSGGCLTLTTVVFWSVQWQKWR